MFRFAAFLLAFLTAIPAMAQWVTNGPAGGTVQAFVVAPSDRDILYAATKQGLFRSGDDGATWRNVNPSLREPVRIAVSHGNPDIVFVVAVKGLFRSDDGGATWEKVGGGMPAHDYRYVTGVAIDPRDSNVVYVSRVCDYMDDIPDFKAGVFKSTDGGRTFRQTIERNSVGWGLCVYQLSLDPEQPDRLFTGSLVTENGGATWRTREGGLPSLAVTEVARDGRRFGASGGLGILTSGDDGATWSRVQVQAGLGRSVSPTALVLEPGTPRLFLGTAAGAYRSANGGLHWLPLGGAARHAIHALDYDRARGRVTIATDLGLFRSVFFPWHDWSLVPIDDGGVSAQRLAADPSNNDVYAVAGRQLFRTRDSGTTWETAGEPLPQEPTRVFVDTAHEVYAQLGEYEGVRLYRLRAEQWELVRELGGFRQLLAVHPHDGGTLYVVRYGNPTVLEVTRDGGVTWESFALPRTEGIRSLLVDPRNPEALLAVTHAALWKSVDGGRTWSDNKVPGFSSITWLVAASSNPDVLYLYGGNSIARSEDGGGTWTTVQTFKPYPDQIYFGDHPAVVDPHDPDTVYFSASDNFGRLSVFRSTDGGRTLESIGDALPDPFTAELRPDLTVLHFRRALAIDAEGRFLFAGTSKHGVWQIRLR